jgi:hypothetical protein
MVYVWLDGHGLILKYVEIISNKVKRHFKR